MIYLEIDIRVSANDEKRESLINFILRNKKDNVFLESRV